MDFYFVTAMFVLAWITWQFIEYLFRKKKVKEEQK